MVLARVHLLNTKPGDCTIIEHVSGRTTMLDICDGNDLTWPWIRAAHNPIQVGQTSNFRMCGETTNPIDYARDLGISRIWRFVLSHPDMDHMDGFNRLVADLGIDNFWHSGAYRPKPTFDVGCPYREEDWDRYERVKAGLQPDVTALQKKAGDLFQFANVGEGQAAGGDGLRILAPDDALLADPNVCDDVNEGSFVILYHSAGGRVLLPGDAHDASWEFIRQSHPLEAANCSFLLAPHHGRDSGRSYDFLDLVRPKLTLIGCAPSEHVDYSQWSRRGLDYITSNQAGNVVLEVEPGKIVVYVQNIDFAVHGRDFRLGVRNAQGYAYCGTITAD